MRGGRREDARKGGREGGAGSEARRRGDEGGKKGSMGGKQRNEEELERAWDT